MPADDDERYELGDAREASLKESLYYIEHGNCSPKVVTRGAEPETVRETTQFRGFRAEIGAY